jgi:hypothetical protein
MTQVYPMGWLIIKGVEDDMRQASFDAARSQ